MMNDDTYQIGLLNALNSKLSKEAGMLKNILNISENAYIYMDFSDRVIHPMGNWMGVFGIEADIVNSLNFLMKYIADEDVDRAINVLNLETKHGIKEEVTVGLKEINRSITIEVHIDYKHNRPNFKVIKMHDVTREKKQNDELSYMAYYDNITGLYNRNYFILSLNQMIEKASDNHNVVSLMFIDIDDFRKVNDGMGIIEGDELVQYVGQYLKELKEDNVIVSHFNSDIFCIAIYDPCGKRSVENVINTLREKLKEPVKLMNGNEVLVTVSIGVAEYPESTESALELINLAEIVMLKAKKQGKNNTQYYAKPIIEEFIGDIELEKRLDKAMKENSFMMYYQPQYDTATKTLRGVEALVRWVDDNGKIISPETFIPMAEKNGSILKLGDWIIEECISSFARWNKKHKMDDFLLSINVSSIQFKNKNFVKNLISVINRYKIKPSNIELEITESVFIDNMKDIIKKMHELREFGIRFSMDDFGTGFSSLSYLRELPIDTLKIDKSFINDVVTDVSTRTIAESIIELSKKLGFDTIAEGVEEEVQYSLLKNMGCENIQGFFLGKPQKFEDIDILLSKFYENRE